MGYFGVLGLGVVVAQRGLWLSASHLLLVSDRACSQVVVLWQIKAFGLWIGGGVLVLDLLSGVTSLHLLLTDIVTILEEGLASLSQSNSHVFLTIVLLQNETRSLVVSGSRPLG